ncbi:transposase [Synechococcus sp. 1G10]|uniref:transposase n=1 Tax=Synechococcus sp. 1G10 TaxID=2025605 RepID=UPI0013038AC2|nr:transposase [Synechococcus sp. 1G10]
MLTPAGLRRSESAISDTRTPSARKVDASHGFIRRLAITPNNIHDSQMLPQVLDPEGRDDYVWADSGYAGARFEDLLDLVSLRVAFMRRVRAAIL